VIFDNLKKSIAYTLASKFPEQVWQQQGNRRCTLLLF
jgi:hypothetical protein